MTNDKRKQLIKLIHVARRELRMEDDTYRLMLVGITELEGVTSTADLSVPNLMKVLDVLKQKGFKVRPNKAGTRPRADDRQSKKIRQLWLALHDVGAVRNPSEEALASFVQGQTGVAALQWLTTAQASQVIEHLKKWQNRLPPKEVV